MDREQCPLSRQPFTDAPELEVFFPGARREEICQSLIFDVLSGKRLMLLVGQQGAGNTTICQMITDRLPPEYEVVFLDSPTGTLEDLLRLACIALGMDPRQHQKTETDNLTERFQNLVEEKNAEHSKVLLLIDEAEQLFLVTLERLICLVNEDQEGRGCTVILSGHVAFETALDQLAPYTTGLKNSPRYVLPDLNAHETRQYLWFCLHAAGMRREQYDALFTVETVAELAEITQGNLQAINRLAQEQLGCTDPEPEAVIRRLRVRSKVPVTRDSFVQELVVFFEQQVMAVYDLLCHNKRLAAAIVGAVALLLLIAVALIGRGGEKTPVVAGTTSRQFVASPSPASSPSLPSAESVVSPSSPTTPLPVSPPSSVLSLSTPSPGQSTSERATSPAPDPAPERVKVDGERLFRERVALSSRWLAGIHQGTFTIHLMTLTSNHAQATMTQMLAHNDYYQICDQLYLFRKKTNPPTLFVFYGQYDSFEAARKAGNDMPSFLRKQHPYPLAISDALKKL